MESLFPAQQPTNTTGRTVLLSFNAGKCIMASPKANGKISVSADNRKGKISVERSTDGNIHFTWSDRSSNAVEDSFLLSQHIVFKKAKTGKDTDRVYLLKIFQQRMMFWMQDRSTDNDQDRCTKVNLYATNPTAAADAANAINRPPASNAQSEAFMQMLGLAPPTAPPAAAAAAVPPPAPQSSLIGNLDLSSLLAQMSGAPLPSQTPAQSSQAAVNASGVNLSDFHAAMMGQTATPNRLSLEDVITADGVLQSGILDDPEVRASLISHLPQGHQTESDLIETLHSPQFQQALRSLSEALTTDNFNSIMANLSIDPTPGTNHMIRGDNVRALLEALVAQYPPSGGETSSSNIPPPNFGDNEEGH